MVDWNIGTDGDIVVVVPAEYPRKSDTKARRGGTGGGGGNTANADEESDADATYCAGWMGGYGRLGGSRWRWSSSSSLLLSSTTAAATRGVNDVGGGCLVSL